MDRLGALLGSGGRGRGLGGLMQTDQNIADTAETTHISSLALLKMLKHGRAGVPMEVMGLMLGEFVDEYTVQVVDVFAMPQSGTGVSVEAVDPVFQTKMLDMLKQTNRHQMVVGWYHSHPGFGCWLSGVDVNCFPVDDHEIWTELGFMSYNSVLEHFKVHSKLGIASYVDGKLVFQDIGIKDISYHEGIHNIVNMVGARNGINICPTDNHNMWVRVGPKDSKVGKSKRIGTPFKSCTAAELVWMGANDPRMSVRFTGQFEEGISHPNEDDSGLSLPFVVPLGLTTTTQVDAFLWLYGYWMSDGWLDAHVGGAWICFGPSKPLDVVKLDEYFGLVGLPRLRRATIGAHGYWRADTPNANGQTTFRICSVSWLRLFNGEYGSKYEYPQKTEVDANVECGEKETWFWYWVKRLLNKRQLRLVMNGLHFADGCAGTDHPKTLTSSIRFRDELMDIGLQAGYSVTFALAVKVGEQRGVNHEGLPIIARRNNWAVHFADYPREAQPSVKISDFTVEKREGAVWCVTVPSPHLIVVRRVLNSEGGVVMAASRPLVVGNTQQSFEQLNKRAVAVVVDPIQSVKGKVVIDAFRLINPQLMMMGIAPRQTTSNLGHLRKPSIQALIHNLNRHYYSINISYRKNDLEQKMLLNLNKKNWTAGLNVKEPIKHSEKNEELMGELLEFSKQYNKRLQEEEGKTSEELVVMNVGKIDPKKHLEQTVETILTNNIAQTLGVMVDTIIF